jgi:hypothetical protein
MTGRGLAEKMRCYQNALAAQKKSLQKFQQINTQYRNEPGKQYAEKAKMFMQGVAGCD